MKKLLKAITISVLIFSGVVLCSCEKKSANQEEYDNNKEKVLGIYTESDIINRADEQSEFDLKDKKEYSQSEVKIENAKVLSGMAVLDNNIYTSDSKNDCILKLDLNGAVIKKVGNSGNGKLEFKKPNAINVFNNKVYVLDSGNNRVQVLDGDLNYLKEFKIDIKKEKNDDPNFSLNKMYVNNEGIYVNGLSLNSNDKIYYYNFKDKKITKIGYNFYGPINGKGKEVYAINSLIKTYDEEGDVFATETGNNYLLEISGNELKVVNELPFGMEISDFTFDGSSIIAFSEANMALVKFDSTGKYLGALSVLKPSDKDLNISISKLNENKIYMTNGYNNVLTVLQKK